ncbi:MAG: M56 family metallopeptidase [Balneolaceae bacterium]|nr:M56 family metallopeptidase [Balneolaceae bacterium]
MTQVTTYLQDFGWLSLDVLWFPLLIWSLCALLVHLALRWIEHGDVLYHYHLRVALVAGIPLGFLASGAAGAISNFLSTSSSSGQLSLLVIQNPIMVTPEVQHAAQTIPWSDPYLWIGLVTALLLAGGLIQLGRMAWNYYRISTYARQLNLVSLAESELINVQDLRLNSEQIMLAISPKTDIPFTFGWRKPVIVIPAFLQQKPEKMRMAIRHELMHIKRGDFLVNGFITAMKSLFWFHPLIHLFDHEIQEYREISCDSEVLTDTTISRKAYASLLFELAPKNSLETANLVSMAVHQSSLKKRINTMMNVTETNRPVVKSVLISLGLLVGISGFIACSDLQSDGLTNDDIQEVQQNMRNAPSSPVQPLYVIREDVNLDGSYENKEIAGKEEIEAISRIKEEYIRSIEVLKGQEATDLYGNQGKNGVVILSLIDKQKALSDLKIRR